MPSYRPSKPGGPSLCSTSTTTLRISSPSSGGRLSSASLTIRSNLAGSMSITTPLSAIDLACQAADRQLILIALGGACRFAQHDPVPRTVAGRAVRRAPVGGGDRGRAVLLGRSDVEGREAEC